MRNLLNIKYVWYQLRRSIRLMILIAGGLSIVYPLSVMLMMSSSSGSPMYQLSTTSNKITALIIFLMVAAMIPLLIFRYLTSKKDLDVYHSLPIKSEALFLSNFLTAMLVVFIPFAFAWIFGFGVEAYYGLETNMGHLLGELGIVFVYLPIIMFPAMLAINNIGTLFDSFIYTGILQIIPFIVMGVVEIYGNTYIFSNNSLLTPEVTTYISYHFAFVQSVLFSRSDFIFYISMVIWPLIGWVLILLNRVLYRVRSVENVEQPKLNKWFTTFIAYILTILVLLIALYSYNFSVTQRVIEFIYPIFTVLVLYLILDAITYRGFSHFFKAVIEFAVLLAVAIGILFGMKSSNGFGIDYIIPESSEVKEVIISSYEELIFLNNQKSSRDRNNYYHYYTVLTDEKDINQVLDFHHYVVETYYEYFDNKNEFDMVIYRLNNTETANHRYNKEFKSRFDENKIDSKDIFRFSYNTAPTVQIRLDYKLENGQTFTRTYSVPDDWVYDLYLLAD